VSSANSHSTKCSVFINLAITNAIFQTLGASLNYKRKKASFLLFTYIQYWVHFICCTAKEKYDLTVSTQGNRQEDENLVYTDEE
jgi:hypothetical protein